LLFSRSLVVLGLSLAMVLVGINSRSGWMYWLAGMLLAALVVSWIDSLLQVRNLEVRRSHPSEVGEDERLEVTLRVRNRGRLPRNLLVVVDEDPAGDRFPRRFRLRAPRKSPLRYLREPGPPSVGSPAEEGGRAVLLLPHLEPGCEAEISYRRGGLRRGTFGSRPVYLYSEGLLGLARHCSRIQVVSPLIVFPSYVELEGFPLLDSSPHVVHAPWRDPSRGDGLDFHGVRDYQPGDSLRHVHWKTTARRARLVVKEYELDTKAPLLISLDNRRDEDNAASLRLLDAQARLVASVARYAYLAGHPVTLVAYRGIRPFSLEMSDFRSALRWLAALKPEGELGPREQLEALHPFLGGTTVLCKLMCWKGEPLPSASVFSRGLQAVLILVEPSRRLAASAGRTSAGGAERDLLRRAREALPGLAHVSLYREGDDMKRCLEEPLSGLEAYPYRKEKRV